MTARYRVLPGSERSIRFTALRFGGASASNVRAFLGSRELSFQTSGSTSERVDGRVDLPVVAERLELRLDYEVSPPYLLDAGEAEVTIPILVPSAPPVRSAANPFRALLAVPGEREVGAAFPASFEVVDPVDRTHGIRSYSFELPAVPAFLRVRVADELSLWSTERAADLLTLAILASLGWVGWRRVRERWS